MGQKYRIGGGLQVIQDGYFIGPVRDPDAPRSPSSLDISAGLMEPDEGLKSTQVREGAEEIVRVKNGTVYLPDIVKDSNVIEQVTGTIAEAIEDPNSPFEHGFDLKFYSSQIEVPTDTLEIWKQGHSVHDWETGVTKEKTNSPSYELVNYIIESPEEDLTPYDTEVIEEDTGNIWLNRFVYCFHPMNGDAKLFKSGREVYSGNFNGMISYIESEFGTELAYTSKIEASLNGLPAENQSVYDRIDFDDEIKRFFKLKQINNS